jgi:hypothetical protein
MSYRVPNSITMETVLFVLFHGWKASSAMLLGMALFKLGAFHAQWSRSGYLLLVGSGLLIGIPCCGAKAPGSRH